MQKQKRKMYNIKKDGFKKIIGKEKRNSYQGKHL